MYACSNCNYELVQLLVSKGAKINDFINVHNSLSYDITYNESNYSTPLFFAITNLSDLSKYKECSRIIFLLIENGANPYERFASNSLVTYIMEIFVYSDEICHILNRLLKIETSYPQLRFHDACVSKKIDIKYVEFLLQNQQINVNFLYSHYRTVLIKCNQINKITLLLENGVDINARDVHGNTPLLIMCENGNFEIVMLLIEKGADPYITNYEAENALMLCSNIQIIEFLLEHFSFDINYSSPIRNRTVLYCAILRYNKNKTFETFNIIELLLKNGANMYQILVNNEDFFIINYHFRNIDLISLAFKYNYILSNNITRIFTYILDDSIKKLFFQEIIKRYIFYFNPLIEFDNNNRYSNNEIIDNLFDRNRIIIQDPILMKEIQELIKVRNAQLMKYSRKDLLLFHHAVKRQSQSNSKCGFFLKATCCKMKSYWFHHLETFLGPSDKIDIGTDMRKLLEFPNN